MFFAGCAFTVDTYYQLYGPGESLRLKANKSRGLNINICVGDQARFPRLQNVLSSLTAVRQVTKWRSR